MNKIDKLLVDLKARQETEEPMCCPRCGRDSMQKPMAHNALSRIADVYVCSDCGMDEAKLAFMKTPGTLYEWAAFQPVRPASDYANCTGKFVWEQIQEHWAETILGLYRCWKNGEAESREVRFRAFESLPGLKQIWTEPFVLHFACA